LWAFRLLSSNTSSQNQSLAPTIAKNSSFKVPESTPNGDYLVRLESNTVHQATAPGGAQFYNSCAKSI
jgi:hypothetical protein